MNKPTALKIVKENYPYQEFKEETSNLLLEESKGTDYRPYYVAAFLMKIEYRKVTRVDEVYMKYSENTIRSLLDMQKSLDETISDIPPNHQIENLLEDEIIEFSTLTTTRNYLKHDR